MVADPKTAALPTLAIICRGVDRPGVLHELTGVILKHDGNIASVDIVERGERSAIYLEIGGARSDDALVRDLQRLEIVDEVERVPGMLQIFGKRIIVVGGGAQVGQVALGAIAEADRHNIRGEKISVDTIPVVGEANLANAVRAVARLPRAVALVLAGALMGGDITKAVQEVRARGILGEPHNGGLGTEGRRPHRPRPGPGGGHEGHGDREDRALRQPQAARAGRMTQP